ncbi:MAG: ZIP family zinc transporter [Actinobacteria bacterium]|nr:ZIP family zinc transporter [Actinomycetota bacterium]
MKIAIIYSFLAGFSLILGVIIGTVFKIRQRIIAAIMAFGSGVLICALTFGLMEEAFKHGGFDAIAIGFLIGGVVFIGGDFLVHRYGGRNYKKKKNFKTVRDTNGKAIILGAALDGIPESIALGLSLLEKNGIGLLMLAAIFLSNLPESISSIDDLRKEGISTKQIYFSWSIVSISSIFAAILSFFFLKNISLNTRGIIEAFASGAILAMLADQEPNGNGIEGGYLIGLLTMLGFLTAFILSKL